MSEPKTITIDLGTLAGRKTAHAYLNALHEELHGRGRSTDDILEDMRRIREMLTDENHIPLVEINRREVLHRLACFARGTINVPEDGDVPLMSEAGTYGLTDKQTGRGILGRWHSLLDVLGVTEDEVWAVKLNRDERGPFFC